MFLGLPRNRTTSETDEKTTDGLARIRTSTPIGITESKEIKRRRNIKKNTKTRIIEQIIKTMFNSRKMRETRILHILTKMLNCKG